MITVVPAVMMTSSEAVGIELVDQVEGVFQFPPAPVDVICACALVLNNTRKSMTKPANPAFNRRSLNTFSGSGLLVAIFLYPLVNSQKAGL